MDLRQLTALVTIADVGSVTKAARLLHLVQPAVTRQIRALEEEVGVPLFERTRQGMVPTAAGRTLIERARRALHELELARTEIRPPGDGKVTGIVRVGLLESVLDVLAEPLVTAVARQHPGIELRILTAYSGYLRDWLESGDLDLSLLYDLDELAALPGSLTVVPLLREPLWALAPPGSGLSPRTPVPWTEVLAQPLVLPVAGHGLRVLIDQARSEVSGAGAAAAGEVRVTAQTNSMHLQKNLVLAGHGWTVLPAAGVAGDVAAGTFSGAPVTGPEIVRSVVLGLPRGRRTPPPVDAVAAGLTRLARELLALNSPARRVNPRCLRGVIHASGEESPLGTGMNGYESGGHYGQPGQFSEQGQFSEHGQRRRRYNDEVYPQFPPGQVPAGRVPATDQFPSQPGPSAYRAPDQVPTEWVPRPAQFHPYQNPVMRQPWNTVPREARPRPVRNHGLRGAEPFWYGLGCVAAGAAYFGKLPAKKAAAEILTELHRAGGGPGSGYRLRGAEKFWYVLLCLPFGGAYFAKVSAKKALWEMITLLEGAPAAYQDALARGLFADHQP